MQFDIITIKTISRATLSITINLSTRRTEKQVQQRAPTDI